MGYLLYVMSVWKKKLSSVLTRREFQNVLHFVKINCLSKTKPTRLNVVLEIKHQTITLPFGINGIIVQPVQ